MSEPQRRAQDQRLLLQRPAILDGLLLGVAVALLTFLGGLLRLPGELPPLWPVAPVLLGVMLRYPQLSHGWAWLGAWAGMAGALYPAGTVPSTACWLAVAAVLSCGLGYITMTQLSPHSTGLRAPASVLHLLLACLVAAVADGLLYAQVAPALALGLPPRNMLHWFGASLVNYVAFLPMVLTLPAHSRPPPYAEEARSGLRLEMRLVLPMLGLALCTTAAWAVQSKVAPALTLPALLWCALAYPLWASAVLVGGIGMLFFLGPLLGWLHVAAPAAQSGQAWVDALALAALMLAALMAASLMASHRDLEQRLRVMADFDPLTRLPVRNAFFQWGHKLLQHRYLQRLPVGVVLLDVDQLQAINDTYGHAAGDKVLTTLGRLLHGCVRRQDCLGRLGGEEFGIIVCNQTVQDVEQMVERICQEFAQQPIVLEHGETVRCSLTAGSVCAEQAPLSLAGLLSQAEQALRIAKRRGKGRWELRPFQPPAGAIHPAPESAAAAAHPAAPQRTTV